jgi:hypothetical protein
MHIDPALLSSASALMGALIGGGTSMAAAVYTQRYQDHLSESRVKLPSGRWFTQSSL